MQKHIELLPILYINYVLLLVNPHVSFDGEDLDSNTLSQNKGHTADWFQTLDSILSKNDRNRNCVLFVKTTLVREVVNERRGRLYL